MIFVEFYDFMVLPKARHRVWDTFFACPGKSTSLILRRKLGGLLTGREEGGRGSHFNGQYLLTDHKKTSDVPLTFPRTSEEDEK